MGKYEEETKDMKMVTIHCKECGRVIGEIEEESYFKAVCKDCEKALPPTF